MKSTPLAGLQTQVFLSSHTNPKCFPPTLKQSFHPLWFPKHRWWRSFHFIAFSCLWRGSKVSAEWQLLWQVHHTKSVMNASLGEGESGIEKTIYRDLKLCLPEAWAPSNGFKHWGSLLRPCQLECYTEILQERLWWTGILRSQCGGSLSQTTLLLCTTHRAPFCPTGLCLKGSFMY